MDMQLDDSHKTNLIHYWHGDSIPSDVMDNISSWTKEGNFSSHLFNRESAARFIAQNFDKKYSLAFEECAVPAMQSDFFRYCFLLKCAGLYVDVHMYNLGRTKELFELAGPRGLLVRREGGNIINGFMYIKRQNDDLIERVLRFAIRNISEKVSQNVWSVTGPGIFHRISGLRDVSKVFSGFRILENSKETEIFRTRHRMHYKSGDSDWRKFKEDSSRSIYLSDYKA